MKVMFLCLGNICRSPLGEALFRKHAKEAGMTVHVESSGTSSYHVGEPPDRGSRDVALRLGGLDITTQRAQQLTQHHLRSFDLIVAMSSSNIEQAGRMHDLEATSAKLMLLRDVEPSPQDQGLDVPDPWGKGTQAFEEVYAIVDRCTKALVERLGQS